MPNKNKVKREFKKVLVANRGEIAIRVIRACRELGLKTVAVYSEADKDCLHTKFADEKICIGPPPATESYLNIPAIVSAAIITGADAIHPGYGFLSENTYFAHVCESCNIVFIGPPSKPVELMGDKIQAKKTAKKLGVPTIPGTDEPVDVNDPNLFKMAKEIGYPVIIKAAGGGGGKGMRIATSEETLKLAIQTASSEAKAAFGNEKVYLEKYFENAKHIEIQVLADQYGNVVSFPERDCSIQRRYQKLIEESPSPFIDKSTREKLRKAAEKLTKGVGYHSVGTVEFIVDENKHFYFMEMNTRIQVEHTITECVTGVDLIREQIKVAMGEKLRLKSDDIEIRQHAIEARINAEDPDMDFMPSPGEVKNLILPAGIGVRVDTHLYQGYTIPTYYDSLIAKLIVYDIERKYAVLRLIRALNEFFIDGIKTTIPLYLRIANNEYFKEGKYFTNFLIKHVFQQV